MLSYLERVFAHVTKLRILGRLPWIIQVAFNAVTGILIRKRQREVGYKENVTTEVEMGVMWP